MARETVLLVDGHSLVFRAFFAMPALSNSRGVMTNAAYGYTSMLLKVFAEHAPSYAIAAFDPPGPTFRHQEFAAYKATRPSMPDDLRHQLPMARAVTEALSIPIVELPGFEADDVIGTLSCRAEAEGLDVLILTGDLDSLQLVTDHVRVYATKRGITETVVYDVDRVRERYGFDPPMVVDFKALQGDVTDNIPGVPGIGEKTAMSLVQQYGPLERILDAVPAMKEGRVRRALEANAEQARLSKRMATIVCDLDVPFDIAGARMREYDRERVLALFEELEFRSLVPRLPHLQAAGAAPPGVAAQPALPLTVERHDVQVRVARDAGEVRALVARLRASAPGVAVRTVVDEPARHGIIAGIALAALDGAGEVTYVPLQHQGDGGALGAEALAPVMELLADPSVRLSSYDLKREVLAWRPRGVHVSGLDTDLLLAAYLVNTRTRVAPLSILAHDLLGVDVEPEDAVLGSGRAARRPTELSAQEAADHYGAWTGMIGPLAEVLQRTLAEWHMRRLYDEIELPLVPILADMEAVGIAIDPQRLEAISVELSARIAAIEREVCELAGYTFNLGSTQQLGRFLYDDLGLASGRKTKTGRSTDADTLEALRLENPVVERILEHRQLTKLKGTYVDVLPQLTERDGRVHTSFHQAVATTGRLSSADPNLQNVPIRTEAGQRVRGAFVADPGCLLVSADYSQIELRVLAHITGDEALVDAFRRGEDIHARTAAEVTGVDSGAITPDMRRNAKVVNFGVLYGLSDFGLARDTGMSREEARLYIERYFATFASITAYQEGVRNHAREWGYVETLYGRRRYLPDIRAANRAIRGAAERMAVNMPIQGTAADIMKLAMIRTGAALRAVGMRARLLLQVHDELVLEAPVDEVPELARVLCEAMGGAAELLVPLDVEVKAGRNWNALEPLPEAAAVTATTS